MLLMAFINIFCRSSVEKLWRQTHPARISVGHGPNANAGLRMRVKNDLLAMPVWHALSHIAFRDCLQTE